MGHEFSKTGCVLNGSRKWEINQGIALVCLRGRLEFRKTIEHECCDPFASLSICLRAAREVEVGIATRRDARLKRLTRRHLVFRYNFIRYKSSPESQSGAVRSKAETKEEEPLSCSNRRPVSTRVHDPDWGL